MQDLSKLRDKVYCHKEYLLPLNPIIVNTYPSIHKKIFHKFEVGKFYDCSLIKYINKGNHIWYCGYFELYHHNIQKIDIAIIEFKKYFWTLEEFRNVKLDKILNT